ncbi:MAG: type II toxin-antitoxin system VapC family toxin [Anaerolineae bacterium]
MTSLLVLDTSVVLKWIRQEEILADRALSILHTYLEGRNRLIVPMLLAYEVANVLRYKPELSTADIALALQSLFDLGLEWVSASSILTQRAMNIARTYDTTVYDAIFAAVAESVGATFVTADARLGQRFNGLPFVVFLGDIGF